MKHLIKSLMTIFVVISMVLCFTGTALAFTFDSELNPEEFYNWERVEFFRTSPYGGVVMLKNPDPNARIKVGSLNIYGGEVLSYSYVIDGKTYTYEFNNETNNYDLIVPNE